MMNMRVALKINSPVILNSKFQLLFIVSLFALIGGCGGTESTPPNHLKETPASNSNPTSNSNTTAPKQPATAGNPAPDFTLPDLDGKMTSLSTYRGKIVVLEWFNPECPFVKLAHGRELSLKDMAKKWTAQGVVWLSINSGAAGMQGHGKDVNRQGAHGLGVPNPILLDEDGQVGRAYGATRTPQMIVIDPTGNIVYDGAIDNTSGGDPDDADPGPATNLVTPILTKLVAKQPVPYTKTKPWGCSVKYAK